MITIYTDTRETKPLEFEQEYITAVFPYGLPYGDYACKYKGKRIPIVFERKSKADLWGTLGSTKAKHERFKRELDRAKADNVKLILIVECGLSSIETGNTYRKKGKIVKCKFGGRALIRKLNTFYHRYDLEYVLCKNREEMSLYISEFFYSYVKNLGVKNGNK